MSLEDALNEHTKAIRELITAFGGKMDRITVRDGLGPEGNTRTEVVDTAKEKPAAVKKPVQTVKEPASTTTQKSENSTAAAQDAKPAIETSTTVDVSDSAQAPITFGTARDRVLLLASKDKRVEVKAINDKYGIPKLSALLADENDYNTVKDQAVLEAVYADLMAVEV